MRRRFVCSVGLDVIVSGVELQIPFLVAGTPHAIGVWLVGRRMSDAGFEIMQAQVDQLEICRAEQKRSEFKENLMATGSLGALRLFGEHLFRQFLGASYS